LETDTKIHFGRKLFRIKAEIDFGIVKKGDLGGYIEKEKNLDMSGNAWVSDDAMVYGDAMVSGEAKVSGSAMVYGDARVYGNARVSGSAMVSGNAEAKTNPAVLINACNWVITKTDKHIQVGCAQKTPEEWIKWLDGNETFETERGTDEFKKIESAIRSICGLFH